MLYSLHYTEQFVDAVIYSEGKNKLPSKLEKKTIENIKDQVKTQANMMNTKTLVSIDSSSLCVGIIL